MNKIFSKILLILIFLFVNHCQAPSTVVFEENTNIKKGMSRKDMAKAFRFKMLGAHNPFKNECFHEYYPLKKMEIISGNAKILTEIDSAVEPVFYVLKDVTISSFKTLLGSNECINGNGKLDAWTKGHYEALDYVSNN